MKIITLEEINHILPSIDLITEIEYGFSAYSGKMAVVPPVGELVLEKGEVHIKYGFIKQDEYYVIKIASGFYKNDEYGLPTGNGMMLLFRQATGEPVCILLDEGHLTDVRTAIAGAIAAKYLAPKNVARIGIVGTGVQARLQLKYLKDVIACRDVMVWGRSEENLSGYAREMESVGFDVDTTSDSSEILGTCNLVVTTTPSSEPLLFAQHLRAGTHITAVGSDVAHKQELDSVILQKADLVVADSISQCLERGEIYRAIMSSHILEEQITELGSIILGKKSGRTSDDETTVADLTGVAVQDIKIGKAVFEAYSESYKS